MICKQIILKQRKKLKKQTKLLTNQSFNIEMIENRPINNPSFEPQLTTTKPDKTLLFIICGEVRINVVQEFRLHKNGTKTNFELFYTTKFVNFPVFSVFNVFVYSDLSFMVLSFLFMPNFRTIFILVYSHSLLQQNKLTNN